mmetsp:Transcript_35672/g.93642  ORF Transcript_35672/g.93642 Transcript_35672/m.93642 type:complete len:148 (+) Transcript_35672:199-642(+)
MRALLFLLPAMSLAFSGEVSGLMRGVSTKPTSASMPRAFGSLAGCAFAACAGAGATAACLPFALQHNVNGAMDTLAASATRSVAGISVQSVLFAPLGFGCQLGPSAVIALILWNALGPIKSTEEQELQSVDACREELINGELVWICA